MQEGEKMSSVYLCIDLKSFFASVECVERGLDPLHTNLVVADNSRTEKTICLAVSPLGQVLNNARSFCSIILSCFGMSFYWFL